MKKPIPAVAMAPDFLTKVRAGYVRQEPTARRLSLAAHETPLSPAYLEQALALSREPIRELLLDMIANAPEEVGPNETPEPDHREAAAQLFLHGLRAGHWTATTREIEQARAQIIVKHGMEAFNMDLAPESMNIGAARTETAATLSKLEAVKTKGGIQLGMALAKASAEMNFVARDPKSTPVTKLEAVQEYLRVLEFLQPGAWAAFCAANPDFVAAARELASRTLKEAKTK